MSDTATTIALLAACASSLSASLAFIAVRGSVAITKAHNALLVEFQRQSRMQAADNVAHWRILQNHSRRLQSVAPENDETTHPH